MEHPVLPKSSLIPSLVSMLAFFALIASLRTNSKKSDLQQGWIRSSLVAFCQIPRAWAITHYLQHPRRSYQAAHRNCLIARDEMVSRRDHCFRRMGPFLVHSCWHAGPPEKSTCSPYWRHSTNQWVAISCPRPVVPSESPDGLVETAFTICPTASHQFMLSTVGEHFGWLGLLGVLVIVALFLLLAAFCCGNFPTTGFETFAAAISDFCS